MSYYRTDDGKCRKFTDDKYTSYCVDGPCPDDTPTNADKIRGMSDAQHAHFLVHVVSDGCPPDMDWDCQKDKDGWDACDKCWEKWLQQPAETEGTE